jgi:protein-histidine N-methyltransferase
MSSLSAEYRSSATDSDSDSDNSVDEDKETTRGRRAAHGRKPGGLTVTRELLEAFTASLDTHKVHLCFFAGSWASLRERLPHQGRPPYDIVLASETIYRTEALDAFLGVLRTATAMPAPAAVADADTASLRDQEVVVVARPPLCLVAAKVLYFGVGGGVQGFVRAVEEENGTVRTVWEHREGVGRIIMRVEW